MKKVALLLLLVFCAFNFGMVGAQDETACESGSTLIAHDLGETCVPQDVERVVTIENSMTETVVTLGVQPVGVTDIELYNARVNLSIPLSEDAVDVGSRQEPNLEIIASLEPDLIIAASWRVAEIYDELSAIAPTITFEGSSSLEIMEDYFTTIATSLNREAEARQILDDMYQYFEDASAAIAAADIDPQFILSMTWYADSVATFRLHTDNAFPIEILEQIGLENTWDGEINPNGFSVVGIEALGEIEDTNFLFITDPESAPFYEESEIWNALPLVESGNAHRLNDDLWLFGGPLSAQRLVEAVLEALDVDVVAGSVSAACESGFHLFEHEMLATDPVCIPDAPQRVVALDTGELDNSLALGANIVGAPTADVLKYQAYLSDELESITDTGGILEPNLETILALEPDLILGSTQRYGDIYDQLSQIAPTVLTKSIRVAWQDNFKLHAEALGKTAAAEPMLAHYETRVEELQAALGDEADNLTVSVVRFFPGSVSIYMNGSYIGQILQEIELQRPQNQNQDEFTLEISLEQIQQADADFIFITGYSMEDSERETFLSSPLWETLNAVQNEHVIEVNDDTWIAGLGIQSANFVIDDLFGYLTDESLQALTPNPFQQAVATEEPTD